MGFLFGVPHFPADRQSLLPLGPAIFANHTIIIAGYTIGVVRNVFIGNFIKTSNGSFYIQ